MCTFLMTLGICLSYSIIIGDFASALSRLDRRICILGITASCLYPLSRLPSLDALAPVSKASIIGVLVTCGVMVYQWSVSSVTSRIVTASGALAPSTNPLTALVLMSMAATSYVCHFSAPEFLESTNRQMDQYKKVTIFGFSTVALINIIILCAGFLTFGRNSAGIILNSYPVSDPLAGLCRLLMLISIIGGYPILLKGTTSALYSLIGTKQKTEGGSARVVSRSVHHAVTVALLTILTLASLVLENAGFVVGFNGATMGSAITYIFPSLMAIKASQRRGESPGWGNRLILGFGVLSAIAGGTVSVLSAFAPHMLQ
jgi:amino acid permease